MDTRENLLHDRLARARSDIQSAQRRLGLALLGKLPADEIRQEVQRLQGEITDVEHMLTAFPSFLASENLGKEQQRAISSKRNRPQLTSKDYLAAKTAFRDSYATLRRGGRVMEEGRKLLELATSVGYQKASDCLDFFATLESSPELLTLKYNASREAQRA